MVTKSNWPVSGLAAASWLFRFGRDPIDFLNRAPRQLGDVFAFGLPGLKRKLIFALSPECHRRVLSDGSAFRGSSVSLRGPAGSALNRLRSGFGSRDSRVHATLRKLVWPAFTRKNVEACADDIAAIASDFVEHWTEQQQVNLWDEMRALSLRLSCRLLFGGQSPGSGEALGAMLQQFLQRSFFSTAYLLPLDWPGTPYRRLLRLSERIAASIDEMVAQRVAARSPRTDLLEMLVRGCQEAGVHPDLVGPAGFLFVASFETVANALTWTLFLLAQHPHVMDDLHDELSGSLGARIPSPDTLAGLPLLDAVLKESMRLFPPVPMVFRTATRDTELAGLPVGRHDWVICSPYVTQRWPSVFDDPKHFRPERWFSAVPDPYAYFPYGAGSHSCLGQFLGSTILKACLATIVQRWRLTVVAGSRIDRTVAITLAPKNGVPMRIWRQDGRFRAVPIQGNVREMVELDALKGQPHLIPLPLAEPAILRRAA